MYVLCWSYYCGCYMLFLTVICGPYHFTNIIGSPYPYSWAKPLNIQPSYPFHTIPPSSSAIDQTDDMFTCHHFTYSTNSSIYHFTCLSPRLPSLHSYSLTPILCVSGTSLFSYISALVILLYFNLKST